MALMTQVVTEHQSAKARRGAVKARRPAAKSPQRNRPASKPIPTAERPAGQGGRRLAEAFEAVSGMPALAESRRRLLHACERDGSSPTEVADAIESDAGLAIAVMRAANNGGGLRTGAGGVRQAIDALSPTGLHAIGASVETYDPFESPTALAERQERFRRHAV